MQSPLTTRRHHAHGTAPGVRRMSLSPRGLRKRASFTRIPPGKLSSPHRLVGARSGLLSPEPEKSISTTQHVGQDEESVPNHQYSKEEDQLLSLLTGLEIPIFPRRPTLPQEDALLRESTPHPVGAYPETPAPFREITPSSREATPVPPEPPKLTSFPRPTYTGKANRWEFLEFCKKYEEEQRRVYEEVVQTVAPSKKLTLKDCLDELRKPVAWDELTKRPYDRLSVLSEAELRRILEEKEQKEIEEQLQREQQAAQEVEERRIREEEERLRKEQELLDLTGGLRAPKAQFISPLSDDWTRRARETIRAPGGKILAQTAENTGLQQHDFAKVVPPTVWLNDEIVNGALLWLEQAINSAAGITNVKTQTRKTLVLSSFFFPNLQKKGPLNTQRPLGRKGVKMENFLDIDSIFMPICEHSHWTLIVVRPQKRTVSHMDSMCPRGNNKYTSLTMAWVKDMLKERFKEDEWKVVTHEAPRQTNGWDCGVHTITNAMCLALGLNPIDTYTSDEMPLQRLRIASILLNKGFEGEFSLSAY
ncbi:Ubiquitin-like-specific protease-like protein [Emericellopsis cladophorae]|uniref:Ubiquitin-like-specific protease-like protein n=1 Tax=Emericellopsis cladophorae TaxID=2686198 RepID=A0A9P9Y2Z4_9HYPO|nr:Ubiquitin-like-specific protease-like protein [Emericellopsis cladophorae]KAI6781994.1 Ubiquitin-like-specific protease-like protein [Emericellopsis cladophorae]